MMHGSCEPNLRTIQARVPDWFESVGRESSSGQQYSLKHMVIRILWVSVVNTTRSHVAVNMQCIQSDIP